MREQQNHVLRPLFGGLGRRVFIGAVLIATGCAGPPQTPAQPGKGPAQAAPSQPAGPKVVTIGLSIGPSALGYLGPRTPVGGFPHFVELHSNGLVTSEVNSRKPIGRLAERAPTVEDGTVSVLPDGRMRVVFQLRQGVTWHDGAPLTVQDLVFSYRFCCEPGFPTDFRNVIRLMDSVEAPDDRTFVVFFKVPNPDGITLGPHAFWPLPRHILEGPYERWLVSNDPEEVLNLPYWTSEYVHTGPFRLTRFDPGEGMELEAYDGYFLGRPKLDVLRVRVITDQNTLLSNVIAGAVQISAPAALVSDAAVELRRQWEASGDGKVLAKESSLRLLEMQWRRAVQIEPALFDPRVRLALLHALDRAAVAEVAVGVREAASSLLSRDDPLYEVTRDGFRRFTYDPERSKALLREAGWSPGSGGLLRHTSDGRPFRTSIWVTSGRGAEGSAIAGYWRVLGMEVEEHMVPGARARDREYRASFPGWYGTGTSVFDQMAGFAATAETNWTGNSNGFEDAAARRLVAPLDSSIDRAERLRAMKTINDYFVAELPLLPLFFIIQYTGVAKGIKAFDDLDGAEGSERIYGSYARNAHLWDLE